MFLLPQNEPFISTEEEGPLTQSPQCLLHFSELHGHCFTLKGKHKRKMQLRKKEPGKGQRSISTGLENKHRSEYTKRLNTEAKAK